MTRPLLLLLLILSACDAEPPPRGDDTEPATYGAPVDPRVRNAVRALEAGLPDAAWIVLDQLGDSIGVDGPLLRARAALLEGDAVGALREIEAARELAPDDGRVYATEAEVLVGLDRIQGAQAAVREGWKRAGRTAELERARGVLLIRTPGGAQEGLIALEAAHELNPELPFLAFPLAQAHMLVGRRLLGTTPEESLRHAASALAFDPDDLDFLELKAEALAALLRFEAALAIYARLVEDGRELGLGPALLHQRCATQLLLQKDRAGAIEHYLMARALGIDDEGLGFGATVLAEEANQAIDTGIERFDAGELEPAARLFEQALVFDPGNLEARNHLAVTRFRQEDFRAAAEQWSRVLEVARTLNLDLPDPVHLNLARAWRLAEESTQARAVLSAYLDSDPEGRWAEDTREMLALLEAEELQDGEE